MIDEETLDRFWSKVEKTNTCWIWTAYLGKGGYGQFNYYRGNLMIAHRFSYELAKGPILDGFVIDHLCRNRVCVNPDHLEAVTLRENIQRGLSGTYQSLNTHCPKGHPYSGKNLRLYNGKRNCRTCQKNNTYLRRKINRVVRADLLTVERHVIY